MVLQYSFLMETDADISNLRDVLRGDRSMDPGRQDHLVGTLEEGHALLRDRFRLKLGELIQVVFDWGYTEQ